MDRWFLIASTLLAVIGGGWGMLAVHRGTRSRWTVLWMAAVLLCQVGFLAQRGQLRGACPLQDLGEILVFLAWAMTVFYMLIGSTYRLSLLGVFTAPLVVALQGSALLFGWLAPAPKYVGETSLFHALHSATSVLAYGALGLAGIAGTMFLVLDRQLKEQVLRSGLFRNLPPARNLLVSMERLLWLGTGLLTVGIVAGFLMPTTTTAHVHFFVAMAVWAAYAGLLAVKSWRGLTGRKLALFAVGIFVLSLLVFASV
jgi:ABC-type uncharacterized transport system permease subunit